MNSTFKKTMPMKYLGLLVFAQLAVSCNSGSSSSGTPLTPEQILQSQIDQLKNSPNISNFTELVKPNAITIVKENLNYEEEKEKYKYGCKTEGTDTSKPLYEIDKDLKLGSRFKEEWAQSNVLRSSSQSVSEKVITQLSKAEIISQVNYESIALFGLPFKSVDEIFSKRPHMISTVKYDFTNPNNYPKSDQNVEVNLTTAAREAIAQANDSGRIYWSCSIDKSSESIFKVDSIRYLISGQPVLAQRMKISRSGPVVCFERKPNDPIPDDKQKKITLGDGIDQIEQITSNEVVSSSITKCGGVLIYMTQSLKLNSGKMLSSWVNKIHEAPLR